MGRWSPDLFLMGRNGHKKLRRLGVSGAFPPRRLDSLWEGPLGKTQCSLVSLRGNVTSPRQGNQLQKPLHSRLWEKERGAADSRLPFPVVPFQALPCPGVGLGVGEERPTFSVNYRYRIRRRP
jgi:hypothetical protein